MEPTGRAVLKMQRKTRPPLRVEDVSARARALSQVIPSRVRLSVLTGASLMKFLTVTSRDTMMSYLSFW